MPPPKQKQKPGESTPAASPSKPGAGAKVVRPQAWQNRLVNRKYVEAARPLPFKELSAFIEHTGRGYYFPLNSNDPVIAAEKAARIYADVVERGWERALDTYAREMTLAVFWLQSPLVATYTTVFSQPLAAAQLKETPAKPAPHGVRILIIEPEPALRRSMAHWIGQIPGCTCAATTASLGEAVTLAPRTPVDFILLNRLLHDASLEDSLLTLKKSWPDVPAFPFGIYASSDELFVGITGVASGYFLRRRIPAQLLEPMGVPRAGLRWTTTKCEASARSYFLSLLSAPQQSEESTDLPLTHREREMLEFLSRGFQDKEIAAALGISVWTVHTHMKSTFEKLGVHNRAEAVSRYLQK